MDDLTTRIAENAANIGMMAMSLLKSNEIEVESQINLTQDIAIKAQEFEQQYKSLDWNETGDYPETIDAFAEKWLTKEYGLETYRPVSGGSALQPKRIHVATVAFRSGDDLAAVYEPLGHALAPVGFYITPFVQEANWLNHSRYGGRMTQHEFLNLLRTVLAPQNIVLCVFVSATPAKDNFINVYVPLDSYKQSVYADSDFRAHVWNGGLPVRF